jgi:anhydro-N-acetylmuramic acid kinase
MNFVAEKTGLTVVADFRRRDMAAGGEGAPLVPLFHAMLLRAAQAGDAVVLNIGGVANATVVHAGGITASDCGPGVGLLNTWMKQRTNAEFDRDAAAALAGQTDAGIVARALRETDFFSRPVPRSADRYDFAKVLDWIAPMTTEDGAATLAALTGAAVMRTLEQLGAPELPLYLCGGGARNPAIVRGLPTARVKPIADLGIDEQAVEAACFAWLAVRRLRHLPTSLPGTTHCTHTTVGGVVTAAPLS